MSYPGPFCFCRLRLSSPRRLASATSAVPTVRRTGLKSLLVKIRGSGAWSRGGLRSSSVYHYFLAHLPFIRFWVPFGSLLSLPLSTTIIPPAPIQNLGKPVVRVRPLLVQVGAFMVWIDARFYVIEAGL